MTMKTDLHRNGGEGPGREELHDWLRHWEAPSPPAGMEDDLREAFRRRRPRRGPALWLGLAAAAVLFSAWWIGSWEREEAPARRAPPPVALSSPPAPAAPREPTVRRPAEAVPATPSGRVAARGLAPRTQRPPEVIVEPGQSRLLAELGRRLGEVRTVTPGAAISTAEPMRVAVSTTVPTMGATSVPAFQGEWETVAGEWPYVHVPSRPGR
jgi:pyruvate/2-oxoglutarate dehydrogenase complex dihydrolipoamide acyltransferase (E2) component